MSRKRTSLEARFWPKVDRRGPDECWPWKASTNPDGYGWIRRIADGLMDLAHRVSWELNRGKIPSGMYVLHSCDNPPCVNPGHLWLGTQVDNMADMTRKGRKIGIVGPHGEAHAFAKVTAEQVREIRRIYAEGEISQKALGERYGLTQSPTSQIIRHETWKHVP